MLVQIQSAAVDAERHRGEADRHARHRSAARAIAQFPSAPAKLVARFRGIVRRDRHSLTPYPCRLPDGKIGRTAFVLRGDEWEPVCRVA